MRGTDLSQTHTALVLDPPDVDPFACLCVASLECTGRDLVLSRLLPLVRHAAQHLVVLDQVLFASVAHVAALVPRFELKGGRERGGIVYNRIDIV